MNFELSLFLFSGLVAMSAALSAGALNKLSLEARPEWLKVDRNRISVVFAGNFAALTLIFALAYGFQVLHWSIPLSSVFISFPLIHLLIVQRLLGDAPSLFVMTPLSLIAAVMLYSYWP